MPTESLLYGRADWPIRQANPERSGGGAAIVVPEEFEFHGQVKP